MTLLESTLQNIHPQNAEARHRARARLEMLTMPYWALGRIMDLAEELAGMTGSLHPPVARKTVITMAADHGITAQGVSKYPREVTAQMVYNFVQGGAGINALARLAGAQVLVVDMGVAGDLSALAKEGKIISKRIGAGTRDMTTGPAMTHEEAVRSVEAGIEVALSLNDSTDIIGTGEMGIGNTTPSSALVSVFSGASVAEVTGRGTGIDEEQYQHKVRMIEKALAINRPDPDDPLDVLAKVGGFEIGGIAGLILGAASLEKTRAGRWLYFDGRGPDCRASGAQSAGLYDCLSPQHGVGTSDRPGPPRQEAPAGPGSPAGGRHRCRAGHASGGSGRPYPDRSGYL